MFTLLASYVYSAQPKSELAPPPPLDPVEGERQARALVANLLAQKPEQDSTNSGLVKLRDNQGRQQQIGARFEVLVTPTNWMSVYQAGPAGTGTQQRFTVVHANGQPNRYLLSTPAGPGVGNAAVQRISSNQLMAPFAGSDFWLADLGLEFLHWPQQRVLKKQMRKNLFCDVLQSTNPNPVPGSYSRVVSWIAVNRPEEIVVVHADAYDSAGKLLKEFDPKRVEKINGAWQLEEMEIRNRQAGTRTRIEFDLDQ